MQVCHRRKDFSSNSLPRMFGGCRGILLVKSIKEESPMSKGMNSLAAGAAVALAAGTAVYLFSGKKRRTVKKLKRSAGKAMKVMEDLAGNVSYMMK